MLTQRPQISGCAGVDRAISIVERALDIFEKPIYVRHEVVHNRYVVDGLKNRGAVFVEELDQVPDDSIVIFSATAAARCIESKLACLALACKATAPNKPKLKIINAISTSISVKPF